MVLKISEAKVPQILVLAWNSGSALYTLADISRLNSVVRNHFPRSGDPGPDQRFGSWFGRNFHPWIIWWSLENLGQFNIGG